MATLIIEDDLEFQNALSARGEMTALFYSACCPFCSEFLPVFERHAEKQPRGFRRVLIDGMSGTEEKYAIEVVPTVIFFKNGKLKARLDGILGVGLNEAELAAFLEDCGAAGAL